MIRKFTLSLVFVVLMSTLAVAADGYYADLEMIIKMDPAMMGGIGEAEGGEDVPEMDDMNFTGQIHWTDAAMRFEMAMFGTSMTTLVKYEEMVAYILDDDTKTAMEIDLAAQAEMMAESGMPNFQPEQMFTNWEDTVAMLKEMPGVTLEELGVEKIAGRDCQKLSMVMDTTAMMKADGMTDEEIAEMGEMESISGVFWVDEGFHLPIRMDMNMMGAELTWLLNNITETDIDAALLSVPEDYEVSSAY